MTVIFRAKTPEGYAIKILAELLQNNIKTACFQIDEKGIRLRMMDHQRTILIDIELHADNFTFYKFTPSEKLDIGINLAHFHKMVKSTKKKDTLEFVINDKALTDLNIEVTPEKSNRTTTSTVKIQNIQNLDIDLPEGYSKPVIVSSSEFQKMCKGLAHISNIVHITSKGFLIRFSSDAGGVMTRYTEFGEKEDCDSDTDAKEDDSVDYEEDFDTEQLTRITKLSGLSQNMQIYPKKNVPLKFTTTVGSLGKMSIYLKSKREQESESHVLESESE